MAINFSYLLDLYDQSSHSLIWYILRSFCCTSWRLLMSYTNGSWNMCKGISMNLHSHLLKELTRSFRQRGLRRTGETQTIRHRYTSPVPTCPNRVEGHQFKFRSATTVTYTHWTFGHSTLCSPSRKARLPTVTGTPIFACSEDKTRLQH